MDSLNTSRPRSSRPRTGVDQLIKSTRSDMPNPLLLAARQVTGPVVATVSDRVRHGFCMGWWRVGFPVPLVVCGRVCRAGVAASQLVEVVPVRHWVSDHLPGAHIIG